MTKIYTDIPSDPNAQAPEPVPYEDPAPVLASKRLPKHWSDKKFMEYLEVISTLIRTQHRNDNFMALRQVVPGQKGDTIEYAKASESAKNLIGCNVLVNALAQIKRISQDHADTIDAVERVCFHRSDPKGSYQKARAIGRKIVKAAGFPGLRVVHTCAVVYDQTDLTWLAVSWNGLHPEWRFEEVDTTRAQNLFHGQVQQKPTNTAEAVNLALREKTA